MSWLSCSNKLHIDYSKSTNLIEFHRLVVQKMLNLYSCKTAPLGYDKASLFKNTCKVIIDRGEWNLKLKHNNGAITIFISIVLSAVLLVVGVFTDAARISLAHSHIQRANKTAISSILASYNNQLKDEYGLFGVYQDNDSIQESYEEYFTKNLNIYQKDDFLYDFNVENINVNQQYNLENRAIFESQILEFMKYRAPYELVSDLLSKFDGMKSISSGSKVCKRILETNKQSGIIGNLQLTLEGKTKKINEMGITAKIVKFKESFLKQNKMYQEYSQKLSSLQALVSCEGDVKKKDELLDSIESVRDELINITNTKQEIKSSILNTLDQYKSLNYEALENAKAITARKGDLSKRIIEEKQYIQDTKDGIQELKQSYDDDLSRIQRIIGEDNSAEIISSLNSNITKCSNISTIADMDEGGFLLELDKLSESSINYIFNKAKPAKSDDEDNRDKVEQTLKKAYSKKRETRIIDDSLLEQLPSRKANIYEEVDSKNLYNISLKSEGFVESFFDDFSFDKNIEANARWQNNFSSVNQIASRITENIYVNEYVMGTFKHDVPLLKGEVESKAYNLRSEDKTKRDGYFSDFEVEYIINGNKDEVMNSLLIRSEILAIRQVANAIHIYTDTSKMARITSLAAALSSWNAGLSTPLIQTMILFSWALAESINDIEKLTKGEKIPLIKTKDQWTTDISGELSKKANVNVKDSPLCLSYQDYLKIFLLMMDKEKKLARIQDLVQLNIGVSNTGFLLEDCKAMLKTNTTVSMKNIFVSFPSFSSKSKRSISRTYISEDVCIGY